MSSSVPLIIGNIVTENSACTGGGICSNGGYPTIVNNIISANSAARGGGIHCEYWGAIIVNNTITHNSANSAGGIYCCKWLNVTLVNTIVWGNDAPQGSQIAMVDVMGRSATLTVSYCDIEGGETGVYVDPVHTLVWMDGNIDADPLFVDPENGDYHLQAGSPCIDAGDPSSPKDPDGTRADIGVLEREPPVATTLEKVSGDNQSGVIGTKLPEPLIVLVKDQHHHPIPNVRVDFARKGGGSVNPTSALTGADGKVSTEFTAGQQVGLIYVTAKVNRLSVTFDISIQAEQVVNIPDPNLEALIRETIGKPTGDITDVDLQGITKLHGFGRSIADLTGLEYCTNLERLYLDHNQIIDISPLSGLVNLGSLGLDHNQIIDISPLSGLVHLGGLDLHTNHISDISPLLDNSEIGGCYVWLYNNPLNYISQKTLIPALEERGVRVDYYAKGVVTLDSAGPPTWSYTLTRQDGYVYNWFYEGAGITGANVTGEAVAAGWTVEYSSTLVTFSNSTPMTSGSLSGFEITGTVEGTGSWLCGRNSCDIEGALPVELLSFTAVTATDSIPLKWRTATETSNLGFNVYRSDTKDGKYTKVNTRLIAGAGSDATPHNYSFTDEKVKLGQTYYYYIEDVDFTGKTNKSDIIEVKVGKQDIKTRPVLPTFALLQNYPNPFNPETWIPYQLAQDSPVTISIYNKKGQLIRTIALGNKNAGVYTTKDKAAYLDGTDSFGEKVASGVYFYTLQAGEFRATRKMVIMK